MTSIHIFRAGNHIANNGTKVSVSESEITDMAEAYDPMVHEAPIVIGHPKNNDPAYGWISGLKAEGGDLFAETRQVNPEFAEMVRGGSFKKVSASVYMPAARTNPKRGKYYLRHLGFLGAVAPSVKGLKSAEFSDDSDNVVSFEEDAAHDFREWSLEQREAAADRRDTENFINGLLDEARILPHEKSGVLAFMEGLSDSENVSFSEWTGEPRTEAQPEWFRNFIKRRPPMVHLGEFAPDKDHHDTSSFSAPDGYTIDPESAKMHSQVIAHQKKHGCDYVTAVRAVIKTG